MKARVSLMTFVLISGIAVSAGGGTRLPAFSVEAGDGRILFDNVEIAEHPYAGSTLYRAVAINHTGCDFKSLELELSFVTGEGDRTTRVEMGAFRSGTAVILSERTVAGPPQEIDHVHGIFVSGPKVCAKALAEQKAAEAQRAKAEAAARPAAATVKTAAERPMNGKTAEPVAAPDPKKFGTGINGLFLGMTAVDLDAMFATSGFPWEAAGGEGSSRELKCRTGADCGIGLEGPGKGRKGQEVERATLEFNRGKVVRIRLRSAPCESHEVAGRLGDWTGTAYDTMILKFGKPARLYCLPNRVGKQLFRNGRAVPFAEWKSGRDVVRVSGVAEDADYRIQVDIEDRDGLSQGGNAGRKGKGTKR
jgi:hypothetical protein